MQFTTIDEAQGAEQFLPTRRVWERYGVTSGTLGRRVKDADLKSHSHSTVIHYYATNPSRAAKCVRNTNIFALPRPSTDRIDQKSVPGEATNRPSQIVITVIPDQRRGRYRAYIGSEAKPLCVSRQPFLDGARKLLERGHDRRTILAMRWAGAKNWALRSSLGAAAKLTVDEHNGTFAKWKPYSRSAVPPGSANTARTVPTNGRAAKKLIPETTAEKGQRTEPLGSSRLA